MKTFLLLVTKQKGTLQKMKHKEGFSLVSFLLYLALFSIATLCMCQVITILIIPSLSSLRKTQSIIALHIATDVFVRDIKNIKDGTCEWNVILPHELIWQEKDRNIGWCFNQDRLERREGTYKKSWQDVKTSIIARGISNASFTADKDEKGIIGVELVLTPQCMPKKTVTSYVCLRRTKT